MQCIPELRVHSRRRQAPFNTRRFYFARPGDQVQAYFNQENATWPAASTISSFSCRRPLLLPIYRDGL